MRVLLTGATGFIGRHLCARLLGDGYEVAAAVRDPSAAERRFPGVHAHAVDMNRMGTPEDWAPLLTGIDAVVNCAGVLQSGGGQSAQAVHADAPKALFAACARAGVRRVVQISAVSADAEAGTEYALTKKAADDYLRGLDLDWVVLRPSLVYGHGSYGGTSAIRALAACPFVTPMVGDGNFSFQPIHVDDLAKAVSRCLTDPTLARRTLEPVGPETLSLADIVVRNRAWLNLPPAPMLRIPVPVVNAAARIGDWLNAGPIRTTAVQQMRYGNVSDAAAFAAVIGFQPRTMADAFRAAPSHTQDLWHARLYALRPAITAMLIALWAGSAVAGLLNVDRAALFLADHLPLTQGSARAASIAFSLIDLSIAGWLLSGRAQGRAQGRVGAVQLVLVTGYTLGIGAFAPSLWLDPFGSLLKNLPILALIAVWTILRDER